MFSISPSREIVTSAAKPCSARRVSSVWPPSITGEGTRGARESIGARIEGPWSSNRMSVTLSTSVVIVSDSTGSRPIVSNSVTTGTFLSRSTLREQPRTRDSGHAAQDTGTPPQARHHPPAPPLTRSARQRPAEPGDGIGDPSRWSACSSDSATRPPAAGCATRQRRIPPATGVLRQPARSRFAPRRAARRFAPTALRQSLEPASRALAVRRCYARASRLLVVCANTTS
jgi:hypothetical protein